MEDVGLREFGQKGIVDVWNCADVQKRGAMAIAEVSAPAILGLDTVSGKVGGGEGSLIFGEGLRIELLYE